MISADDVKANNKNKKYIANILVALPYKFCCNKYLQNLK